jgi:hypothetical protein
VEIGLEGGREETYKDQLRGRCSDTGARYGGQDCSLGEEIEGNR